MSEQAPDVIKELVEKMSWSCPADVTTMKFVKYTIDAQGMNLIIVVSCPKCGKKIWIRWQYEMDGEVKQERTVNDGSNDTRKLACPGGKATRERP